MASKQDTNLYLFYEFGVEGDEAQVSEDWPFELRKVGSIKAGNAESVVYEFLSDGEMYYAVDLGALTFYPAEGLSIEQLQLQEEGSYWIGQHEPIDLRTVRIGDDSVPRTPERRAAIVELAARSLSWSPESVKILEGLFLKRDGPYPALVENAESGEMYVVGSGFAPRRTELPGVSHWRQLSLAVGEMLRTGEIDVQQKTGGVE